MSDQIDPSGHSGVAINQNADTILRVSISPDGTVRNTESGNLDTRTNDPTTGAFKGVAINQEAGKVYNLNGDNGEVRGTTQRYTNGQDRAQATGILATARTAFGTTPAKVGPRDTVLVGGVETSVAAAVQAGFLAVDGNGNYIENQAQPTTAEQPTEQDAGPVAFPEGHEGAEQLFSELQAALPESRFNSLLVSLMQGKVTAAMAHDLGAEFGTDGDSVEDGFGALVNAFSASAASVMQKSGVALSDCEDAYEWAREQRPDLLREANMRLVMTRDPRGFAAIADAYLRANPPTREAAEAAGVKVYAGADGKTPMVKVRGMEMPLAVAARNGWL